MLSCVKLIQICICIPVREIVNLILPRNCRLAEHSRGIQGDAALMDVFSVKVSEHLLLEMRVEQSGF